MDRNDSNINKIISNADLAKRSRKANQIEKKADQNIDTFKNCQETVFNNLGSHEAMLTNIDDMKNKINTLREEGEIKKGDSDDEHLKGFIERAYELHSEPNKSANDIFRFYKNYDSFNEIIKRRDKNV